MKFLNRQAIEVVAVLVSDKDEVRLRQLREVSVSTDRVKSMAFPLNINISEPSRGMRSRDSLREGTILSVSNFVWPKLGGHGRADQQQDGHASVEMV